MKISLVGYPEYPGNVIPSQQCPGPLRNHWLSIAVYGVTLLIKPSSQHLSRRWPKQQWAPLYVCAERDWDPILHLKSTCKPPLTPKYYIYHDGTNLSNTFLRNCVEICARTEIQGLVVLISRSTKKDYKGYPRNVGFRT